MMIERPQDEEMNMSAQAMEQEMNEDADHLLSWDEWLRRHVSQLLLFARQQSRSPEDAEDILEACSADPAQDACTDPWFSSSAADEELKQFMEMQLKKLPSKFSEVIVLKIWGEQTFLQIAETLEISQNTVASRYRYGIDMLRKALRNRKEEI